jgi:hypothetical protein
MTDTEDTALFHQTMPFTERIGVETEIHDSVGKLAAKVTQTQAVL